MKPPIASVDQQPKNVNPWPLIRPGLSKKSLDNRSDRDFKYGLSYGRDFQIFREDDGSYTFTCHGGEVAQVTVDDELRLITTEMSDGRVSPQACAERWKWLTPLYFSTQRRKRANGEYVRHVRYGQRTGVFNFHNRELHVGIAEDCSQTLSIRDGMILRGRQLANKGDARTHLRIWLEPSDVTEEPRFKRDDELYKEFNKYLRDVMKAFRTYGRMGGFSWFNKFLINHYSPTGEGIRRHMREAKHPEYKKLPSQFRSSGYWMDRDAAKKYLQDQLIAHFEGGKTIDSDIFPLILVTYDATYSNNLPDHLKSLASTAYRDLQTRFLRAKCLTPIDTKSAHAKSDQSRIIQPDARL